MSLIAGNLGLIQRLLDEHQVEWGIYGGAAAHIYGNRRPIKNIDILVSSGILRDIIQYMKDVKKVGQFDGRRIMWSGINLCDDLSVKLSGTTYPIKLDQPMLEHRRDLPLLGSRVKFIAPEDVVVHKLLQRRGESEGKLDLEDATSIVQRQQLDMEYLRERLRLSHSLDALTPKLQELGIDVA